MPTDQSTLCKITNQSGKDMMIALVLSGDEAAGQQAGTTFNRQFELLSLAEGGTVLKNEATGSVSLDQRYQPGNGSEGAVKEYGLITGDSTWLYPLAYLDVSQQQNNGSTSYQAQTVTPASMQPIGQAVNFYQTISAYPNSQLAADYMKALEGVKGAALAKADGNSGSAQAVLDAMDGAVRALFQSTKEYKDVTLHDIAAVSSYYAGFPFVWAQYKDTITYYLYGSDGEKAQFAGTLSLEKSGAADVLKANGGYTCLFTPAATPDDTSKTTTDPSKAVQLTYSNGVFVEDAAAASPKIALQGCFMLKRFFTAKEEDTQVITVVGGRCNGISCIGFDTPQRSKAKHKTAMIVATETPVEKYWNALIHPKTQLDMIVSILTFIGAAAFIAINAVLIYNVYRFVKARRQAAEKLAAEDLNSGWERISSDSESEEGVFFKEYVEGKGWKKVDFSKVRAELEAEGLEMVKGKLIEGLQAQFDSLDNILEFRKLMTTADVVEAQVAAAHVNKSLDALDAASPATLKDLIAGEYKAFTERQPVIQGVLDNASKVIKDKARETVEESLKTSEEVINKIKDMQQDDETVIEEEDPFVRDPIRPWEWR